MARPNFFILLELDCGEKDARRITDAIRRKQGEWSRDRSHPTRGRQAQLYLGLLDEIRKTMLDPSLRAREAGECVRLRKGAAEDLHREVDQHVEVLAAKGHLFESEVADLVKRLGVNEHDVRSRVKVEIKPDSARGAESKPLLDKSVMNRIKETLSIVGKNDLYDFLGLPAKSSLAALHSRARDLYDESRRNNNKDAQVTAQGELAGYCLTVFKNEQEREKYDNSEARAALRDLEDLVCSAGSNGTIEAAAMAKLLRIARGKGITPDEAKEFIRGIAEQRGWFVELPDLQRMPSTQRCGKCNVLNPESATHCGGCGELLEVTCPQCGGVNASENRTCWNCGFAVGDATFVKECLKEADLALVEGKLGVAKELYREALELWPECEEARQGLTNVGQRRDEREAMLANVFQAADQLHFCRARQLLARLRQDGVSASSQIQQISQRIDQALETAEQQTRAGRAFEQSGQLDAAVEAYCDALEYCRDWKPAADALTKYPPRPTGPVTVEVTEEAARISWVPSSSPGRLEYVIVRKAGTPPRSATDGDVIKKTNSTRIDDPAPDPGISYFYAVFVSRWGTLSRTATVSEAVLRAADVSDLEIIPADGAVSLCWNVPTSADGVEVWKKAGFPPQRRRDGVKLANSSREGTIDADVINGRTYGYLVIAYYKLADGSILFSGGVKSTARPSEMPEPVTDLVAQQQGTEFLCTWTIPSYGQAQIYGSTDPHAFEIGQIIPVSRVRELGNRVKQLTANTARVQTANERVVYLTPATLSKDVAIVGRTIAVSSIPDVSDVYARAENGQLTVEWNWPTGVDMALVVWRSDQFPTSPKDPRANSDFFSRHQLTRGPFIADAADSSNVHVVVYSAVKVRDTWLYSGGSTPGSRSECAINERRHLTYQVTVASHNLLRRPLRYQLTIIPDAAMRLPELVLIARSHGPPLAPDQGTQVLLLHTDEVFSPDEPFVTLIPADQVPPKCHFRLFAVDSNDYQWLDIEQG